MARAVQLVNPANNKVAFGYQGISWTCLFFGPLPALFRGHILGFVVMLALPFVTFGAAYLFFIFFYNRWHYSWLLGKGFSPTGAAGSSQTVTSQNIIHVSVGGAAAEAPAKQAAV